MRDYVLDQLGTPDKERGIEGQSWSLQWFREADRQGTSAPQLRIRVKRSMYSDLVRGENVPYTRIGYSAWLCTTLPKCME